MKSKDNFSLELFFGIVICLLYVMRVFLIKPDFSVIGTTLTTYRFCCVIFNFVICLLVLIRLIYYFLLPFNSLPKVQILYIKILKHVYYKPLQEFGNFLLGFNAIKKTIINFIIPEFKLLDKKYKVYILILFFYILPRISFVLALYTDICVLHKMILSPATVFYTLYPIITQGLLGLIALQLKKLPDTKQLYLIPNERLNFIFHSLNSKCMQIFFIFFYSTLFYCWYNYLLQL